MSGSFRFEVDFHPGAEKEFKKIRDQQLRLAILRVVETLKRNGPDIGMPHARSPLAGCIRLSELRPKSGQSNVRPLYAQVDHGYFVVFAIAPEAMNNPQGFRRAQDRARRRAKQEFGLAI